MKTNTWASRYGKQRRAKDIALLRELERSIPGEPRQDAQIDRDALAAAFGRPYTPWTPKGR